MDTHTIHPPRLFAIRVAGGIAVAADAIAKHLGPSPMRPGAWVNGFGAAHCRVYADVDALRAWFRSEHDVTLPGKLIWWQSVDE